MCKECGFIMHIVRHLLNSVEGFHIGGVFGVVSFPRCVLRAPPCRRGGDLVVYSQSALVRHIKSGVQYVSALPPCMSGVLACLHAGLVEQLFTNS